MFEGSYKKDEGKVIFKAEAVGQVRDRVRKVLWLKASGIAYKVEGRDILLETSRREARRAAAAFGMDAVVETVNRRKGFNCFDIIRLRPRA